MSEESEKPREIVSSYDEILEITGLLPICDNRKSYVGDDKEDKENSSPQDEGGNGDNILRLGGGVSRENDGDDDDEGIVPVLSAIQLQHGSSLLSITVDENNTTNVRTISIAKTKNNDVGFMFTEIKQFYDATGQLVSRANYDLNLILLEGIHEQLWFMDLTHTQQLATNRLED
ncbi:unnamed protein product [Trichobilharzia regenti]|nr:unnamed protein product [Trichobilharzia regenti]